MPEVYPGDGPAITLGGQTRRLRFTVHTFRLLREELGIDFFELNRHDGDGSVERNPFADMPLDRFATVVWAALTGADPTLDGPVGSRERADGIATVEDWIDIGAYGPLITATFDALLGAVPRGSTDDAGGDAGPLSPTRRGRSTGSPSGRRRASISG